MSWCDHILTPINKEMYHVKTVCMSSCFQYHIIDIEFFLGHMTCLVSSAPITAHQTCHVTPKNLYWYRYDIGNRNNSNREHQMFSVNQLQGGPLKPREDRAPSGRSHRWWRDCSFHKFYFQCQMPPVGNLLIIKSWQTTLIWRLLSGPSIHPLELSADLREVFTVPCSPCWKCLLAFSHSHLRIY